MQKEKSHSLNPLTGGSLNHNFNLVLTIDNCQKNFLKKTAWKEENLIMKTEGIITLNKWQIGSKMKHTLEIPGVVIILHVSESMWKHSQLPMFQDWEGCLKAMQLTVVAKCLTLQGCLQFLCHFFTSIGSSRDATSASVVRPTICYVLNPYLTKHFAFVAEALLSRDYWLSMKLILQ